MTRAPGVKPRLDELLTREQLTLSIDEMSRMLSVAKTNIRVAARELVDEGKAIRVGLGLYRSKKTATPIGVS